MNLNKENLFLLCCLYKNYFVSKFKTPLKLFFKLELEEFLPLILHPLQLDNQSFVTKQIKLKLTSKFSLMFKSLKLLKKNQKKKKWRRKLKRKTNVLTNLSLSLLYLHPITKIFFKQKKKKMAPLLKYYWWYKCFLKLLTWQQLAFHNDWKLINANKIIKKGAYQKIIRRLYKRKVLRFFYRKRLAFLWWFCPLTLCKNPRSYTIPITKWLSQVNLKRHKRLFYRIGKFLRLWYLTLYKHGKIRGYCVFFKGKLGRKGSVRKKKFFAKKGEVSYSTKNLKVNYHTFRFFTITGTVGGGLSVFY